MDALDRNTDHRRDGFEQLAPIRVLLVGLEPRRRNRIGARSGRYDI
jgi:hypothetical protein